MYKSYSMELAGRTLTVDIGRVAKQANGAALMHYGDTTVLATATASKEPREGIDFFPLSVEYEEKMYAVGKIPGGFNKREGKASEHAILTSRVIDRPMRPLFPKDYRNDVTLVDMVMSVDPECNPEIPAMLGSSLATCISDIPFDGPCATTQIGLINGEYVVNPTLAQKDISDLQLTVASTRDKVIMIEAGANEVPEDQMIEAIYKAHEVNQEIIRFFDQIIAECGKEKHSYESCAVPQELFDAIKEIVPPEEMEVAVFSDDKQTRENNIAEITDKLKEAFAEKEEWLAVLGEAVYQYQKKTVRKMILKDHKRPDGRAITQIRPLAAEVDIIPRVHGSAMFTRGQTQILNICTLAPLSEAQKISDKYIHPPATTDFAIMFLPTEGLYSEAMRMDGLGETLQTQYRVLVAGPSTLCALLSSLRVGFQTLAIQQRSSEVWQLLGKVKSQYADFTALLERTRAKLSEASGAIDRAEQRSRAIQKSLSNVERMDTPMPNGRFDDEE